MKDGYGKINRISKRLHEIALKQIECNLLEGEKKRSIQADILCALGAQKNYLDVILTEMSKQ